MKQGYMKLNDGRMAEDQLFEANLRRWVKHRTKSELETARREIEIELTYREKEMVG